MDEITRNALNDPKVTIFFVPTPYLRELVVNGVHPAVANLVAPAKADLLSGHGIATDAQTIVDFMEGTLDERFAFILRHSDIRILGAEEVLLKLKEQRKPAQS